MSAPVSVEPNDGSMNPDSGATSRTYLSRIATEFKTADASAQFVIYGFYITQYRTKFGRIIAESPERRAVIASIDLSKLISLALPSVLGGSGGTANGKYCVKPVYNSSGVLLRLDFGTEQELDSDTPSFSVATSVCPNVPSS